MELSEIKYTKNIAIIAAYSKNHTSLVREINLQDLGAFLSSRPSASFKNPESTSVLEIYLHRTRAVLYMSVPHVLRISQERK